MRRKLNWRVLLVLGSFLPGLLWYGYVLADQLIYHGIEPHDGYTDVDLKTLGCFGFNADTDSINQVPARFRALDGKRIVLKGFMYNDRTASREVRDFQFVYNVQVCCFGTAPQVQERVFARCKPGTTVPFFNGYVTLTGILHVKLERDRQTGAVMAVYEMDVENVG